MSTCRWCCAGNSDLCLNAVCRILRLLFPHKEFFVHFSHASPKKQVKTRASSKGKMVAFKMREGLGNQGRQTAGMYFSGWRLWVSKVSSALAEEVRL